MNNKIRMAAFASAMVICLAGCENLDPLKADVSGLKTQVSRLQSQLETTRKAADDANAAAAAANQAASGAQSTASQALAGAQSGQACCNAMSEKLERAFRRSISK